MKDTISQVMDLYPKIFFACHTRHVTDNDVKLTANQVSILDHLDEQEAITLFELAQHMGVTPSTMSVAINRLTALGYVARIKDKEDARKTNLTLTKQGSRIKKASSVLDPGRVRELLEQLDNNARAKALEGLVLLADAAATLMKHQSMDKSWNNRTSKPQL